MEKIAFVSQPEYFLYHYDGVRLDNYEIKEFGFHFDYGIDKFQELINFNADYNFFFRGEFIPDSVIESLTGLKINLSSEPFPRKINSKWNFTKDSLIRYKVFRNIRKKHYDYLFHYDIASEPLFKIDGITISGELNFPISLSKYMPVENTKQWDIFFIGRSTVHRETFFGYPKHVYNFLHIVHGIYGTSLIEYISKSKINLNVHAENEISWEPRLQMLLACGAFVISEKITPNSYLTPNSDYIEFINRNDFIQKLEYYLHHEEERKEIAKNGYNKIKLMFDSEKVYSKIINDIKNNSINRFSSDDTKCTRLISFILNFIK